MKQLLAGTLLALAAIVLQLAMVVRLVEPSLALSLAGYAGLVAGMALAAAGVIAVRR